MITKSSTGFTRAVELTMKLTMATLFRRYIRSTFDVTQDIPWTKREEEEWEISIVDQNRFPRNKQI